MDCHSARFRTWCQIPATSVVTDRKLLHNKKSMNEQNLLFKHQIATIFTLPDGATDEQDDCEEGVDAVRLRLTSVELEESVALEKHRELFETFHILDTIIEHLLTHIDCVLLESKSAARLVTWLQPYSTLKNPDEPPLSTLNGFKAKLLTILNNDYVKKLHNEFRQRQANYKLALKNFKIILEIFNVNVGDSLTKLKRQFDEVLMDYQHWRCILDQELPFAIAERTKLLGDCFSLLGAEYDGLADRRRALGSLLKDVKMQDNELVKEEEHE